VSTRQARQKGKEADMDVGSDVGLDEGEDAVAETIWAARMSEMGSKERRQTKEEEKVVRSVEKGSGRDGRKGKRGKVVRDEHRARVLPSAVVCPTVSQ